MNKDEFQEFYLNYRRFSMSAAFRIIRDRDLAEDICHEVFLYLYGIRDQLDGTSERKLKALIFHATVNKSRDCLKRAYRRHEILEGEKKKDILSEGSDPEEIYLRGEENRYRKIVLEKLRETSRINYYILIKTKFYEIHPGDVAKETGLSRENINNRIFRTRIWMERELKKLRRQN